VTDFISEVDEEVRREQLKRIWERFGALILLAAVLVVAGVGGWRGYNWWEGKKAAEFGAAFEAAVALADQNKGAEAEAAFAKIATEAPRNYQTLARFREAIELAKREPQAAVAKFDAIANDNSINESFRDASQLRATSALLDTAPYADIEKRLTPLTGPGRTFRYTAYELLALAAWRVNDEATTRKWLDIILNDSDAPANLRSRADALLALLPPVAKS
jgi:hypothetical protein